MHSMRRSRVHSRANFSNIDSSFLRFVRFTRSEVWNDSPRCPRLMLPAGAVSVATKLTANLSAEAFYQYDWDPAIIPDRSSDTTRTSTSRFTWVRAAWSCVLARILPTPVN